MGQDYLLTFISPSRGLRARIRSLPLVKRLWRLLRAADGTSALEFGLAVPILAAVLTPVIDLGQAFHQQMQVQNAAQAGVQYALRHGWDSTSITNAISSATTLRTISASPSESCGCPNGSGVTTVSCSSTCSDGMSAGTYVTVSAQSTYTPTLPYSLLGSSTTLSAHATVRIW